MPYFTNRGIIPLEGAFTPDSIPSLVAWYKADTGVSTSGGNVTAVVDQSGNGNNLTNTGNIPFNATGYNSLPAFEPVVANDAGLLCASFGLGTGTGLSVFVVGEMNTSTDENGGIVCYGTGAGVDYGVLGSFAFSRDSVNAGLNMTHNSNNALASMSVGAHHRFGATVDLSGNSSIVYVDNVAGTPGTPGTGNFTNNGTLVIGARWLSAFAGTTAFQGKLVEIVICNAVISTDDRNSLDAYFVARLGS